MVSDWRQSTWGDEISLEYGKALRGYSETQGHYRVFGSNGPIGWTSDSLAMGPGVILGRKGAYRGVEYWSDPFWVIDTAYYVVPKTDLDMRWLFYAIKYYKLGEIDDGSPIPSTTRAAVYVRNLAVPSFGEQRAIAYILGSLDDKIELNQKINYTLEQVACALFKSWFVDNAEKILFGDLVQPKKGKNITKSKAIAGEFPVVAGGIQPSCYHNESNTKAPVVTISASGANAGFIKLYHTPVWSSDSSFIDESITPYVYFSYVFLKINQKQLFEKQEGSAQPHIYPSHIMELEMAAVPQHLIKKYESTVSPLFQKIKLNLQQNNILIHLRNTLQSKLISGELRVKNAEKIIGDTK